MNAIDKMRKALRDIECRASTTLVHQTDDEDENRRLLARELDEIERIARSATWGESVPGKVVEVAE